jgi:parvulin-like peptidyl-prolyl isomerase
MTRFAIAVLVCLAASAQSLPNLPDETVVAVFDDGVKFTMGDFKRLYPALPADLQKLAAQDRGGFVQQWALMRKLAKMAENDKLDQLSPTKEALEFSQAKMDDTALHTAVLPSQVAEFYEANQDRYRQVRVKAIYIGLGGRRKAEAEAKAVRVTSQARAGVDFVKLVRENSDDESSRAKDGDFLTIRGADNLPDDVRAAILRLKKGEVSDPVPQSNGYYIFRVEDISVRPLEEVRDEIFGELKHRHFAEWVDQTRRGVGVQFTNLEFIGAVPFPTTPKK